VFFLHSRTYVHTSLGHQSSFHHQMITISMFSSGDENVGLNSHRTGTRNSTQHKVSSPDNMNWKMINKISLFRRKTSKKHIYQLSQIIEIIYVESNIRYYEILIRMRIRDSSNRWSQLKNKIKLKKPFSVLFV